MRIYLFNTENGIFEGESFEDADRLDSIDGMTSVSPPAYERGHVPIFDKERNAWEIVRIDTAANTTILQSGKPDEK